MNAIAGCWRRMDSGDQDGVGKAGGCQAHSPRFSEVPQGGGPAEWWSLLFTAIYLP